MTEQESGKDEEGQERRSGAWSSHEVEERLYRLWVERGDFHANALSHKPSYSVVIPPPNVTDVLHIGHALNNTIQDILVRKHRMSGFETCWVPGADHAGIATQVIVEKQLAKEGTTRREVGREAFLDRTRSWANRNKEIILGQLRRMGCSCDWERTRFTLDPSLSRAVGVMFKRLYDKGLIYRGHRIVNWCPNCGTSLSDDEVENRTLDSSLWYIRYKVKGEDEYLVVATTRPETMFGDTAVAVSPEDTRYKRFIGKTVILPVVDREIPVVADTYVEADFGSGVVKITPAHDPNDFELAKRHDLPELIVMNPNATLNEHAGKYKGMDRYEARKRLIEELTQKNLIEKIEKYQFTAGSCYRCHTIVEPYLSDQWFVKMNELAKPAIEAAKRGELRFHPEFWVKTYLHWMENIRDWCISRQLWWGHRIPVWYAPDGTMFVSVDRPTADECKGYDPAALRQDEDVLDTWFSSWLWPLTTFGWPDTPEPDLPKFYPTKVLVTASEIIFLWVARMVMAGYEVLGKAPFSDVYIHGTVRDANGIKMSKSLGNGINPLEIIEKHGADALRISLVMATPDGQDPWISKNTFEGGRNFVNKLHQVSRFLLMRLGENPAYTTYDQGDLVLFDRWILSRLERTKDAVEKSFAEYRLSAATKALYSFVWNDYCSWYIELIKPDAPGIPIREGSLRVACYVMDEILRLLHPFVPFVTEQIYLDMHGGHNGIRTLSFGPWPAIHSERIDEQLEASLEQIQAVVMAVRSMRSELNVPPGKRSDLYVHVSDPEHGKLLEHHVVYFRSLAKIDRLYVGTDVKKPPVSASAVLSGAEIFLPLAGLIDLDAEKNRLQKELDNLKGLLEKVSKKLGNADFMQNAPEDVIDKEQAKREDYLERIEKLNKNLEQVMGW